jgi:hypothetical protein
MELPHDLDDDTCHVGAMVEFRFAARRREYIGVIIREVPS